MNTTATLTRSQVRRGTRVNVAYLSANGTAYRTVTGIVAANGPQVLRLRADDGAWVEVHRVARVAITAW